MAKVLWITVDDTSYSMLSRRATELGVAHVPATPVLDAFQDGGINYTRFYGESKCSPTRADAMLGKYTWRSGMGLNAKITEPGAPAIGESWLCSGLPGGVTKGTFGKWHLMSSEHTFDSARQAGQFDTHIGAALGNLNTSSDTYWYWVRFVDGIPKDLANNPLRIGDTGDPPNDIQNRDAENYCTTIEMQDAKTWIEAQVGDWFCWLQFNSNHTPIAPPPTAAERATAGITPNQLTSVAMETVLTNFRIYSGELAGDPVAAAAALVAAGWDPDTEAGLASYLGMMEAIDTEIGVLLGSSAIDTAVDTHVFIFSDNGENELYVQPPMDPEKSKGTQHELAARLPMIYQGPTVPANSKGRDCRSLFHAVDLWATTLGIFGVDPDVAFAGVDHDSIDISPTFTDLEARPRSVGFISGFELQINNGLTGSNPKGGIINAATGETADPNYGPVTVWNRAVFNDNYKLITRMPTGPADMVDGQTPAVDITYEFYNMRSDYLEENNLIAIPSQFPTSVESFSGNESAWRAFRSLKAAEDALLPYP